MIKSFLSVFLIFMLSGCEIGDKGQVSISAHVEKLKEILVLPELVTGKPVVAADINLERDLLYDKYTLKDVYPYKDTVRSVKWKAIKECLAYLENMNMPSHKWCVLQNYRNINGEAALVKSFVRNEYKRVSDTLGVERFQSVPLYSSSDTITPVRYGRDGTLCKVMGENGGSYLVQPITFKDKWLVPARYVKMLSDTISLDHVIVVDRGNQNIATLERTSKLNWKIRSVNPATTGMHAPPYAQETPLGTYLLQQKKEKMLFLKDGSKALGGYAPYANRFTNGAYIHGVPVNVPATKMIEYSWSLGTTPRSHMCVRNATSHSKFIYDWAPVENSLVIVIE